jgi:hypothetical protein
MSIDGADYHDPLSSAGRLVGVLRPIVEAFVLAVLDAGHDLTLGRGIVFQFAGDQHTRRTLLLPQKFAQQAFGSLLVASALDKDVENITLLIDRTPEPMLLPGDADDDLVQASFVATTWHSPTDAVGRFTAEFRAPLTDRLVCHRDATRRRHLSDHTQPQREAEIQPDRIARSRSA